MELKVLARLPPVGIVINPPKTLDPPEAPSVKVPFNAKAPLKVVTPVFVFVSAIEAFIVTAFNVLFPEPVKD